MTTAPHSFDYAAAAADICRDFPEVAAHLYFFDTARKAYVTSHPEAARKLDRISKSQENFGRHLAEFLDRLNSDRASCVFPAPLNDHFVFIYNGPQDGGLLPRRPHSQRMLFILDHEIGHIVTPTGKPDRTASPAQHESTADVFAALRHIQRFGRQTGAIEDLLLLRAQRLVSLHGARHAGHFSSFALEALLEKLPALDIEYLSPRQTAALASRIACAHAPDKSLLDKLSGAFVPFKDMLAAGAAGDTAYRCLAGIVLGTADADIFKWGAPVLRGYMDGKLGDMRNGKDYICVNSAPLRGGDWDSIGRQLTEKEFAADRDTMLQTSNPEKPAAPARKISPSP